MERFRTIDDVWKYLDTIPMFGKVGISAGNFDLNAIRTFCVRMGAPQRDTPAVHIAGTNGKGTTAWLLEAIYRKAGYRTGMFTSPHLSRYNERIRINGKDVDDDLILAFFVENDALLKQIKLTYFEVSTALAFWILAREKVDIAIIETGLGGRLDATNIIKPLVSVITSIGLDHQDILGESLSEIAMEKAGIIKRNVPVVVGELPLAADRVISARSGVEQSRVYRAADLRPVFDNGDILFKKTGQNYKTSFAEAINKWNLAIVRQVTDVLQDRFPVKEQDFREAVTTFSGVPGRFERLHTNFRWFFSGAHNADALRSVLNTARSFEQEPVLILSFMKDKLTAEVCDLFTGFDNILYHPQEGIRAADEDFIKNRLDGRIVKDPEITDTLNELKTSLVIFTGSFYFYPIVKRWISKV